MSWNTMRLGDLCQINMGKTPSRSNQIYWNGDLPWVSIGDLTGEYFISSTKECITAIAVKESGIKVVPPNTLLYSFKLSIGKVAVTRNEIYTNEAIVALPIINPKIIDLKYLYWAIQKIDLSGIGDKAVKGITLNKEKLKELQIPLPPLPIQKRIAEILDAADALRRKDQQLLKKYDELAQAIFIDMFGDPVKNEKGWEVKTIEQIVKKGRHTIKRGPFGGALKKEIFVSSGYLVYEQFHALNNDFSFKRYFIDEAKYKELIAFDVKPGDIIISCSGIYLGKLAIVPPNALPGIINQALLKITLDNKLYSSEFFLKVFTQKNFKEKYFASERGAAIPNFPPMTTFKEFGFIAPPITLQNEYLAITNNINIQINKLNLQILQSERLFQTLIQKAFNGKPFNS